MMCGRSIVNLILTGTQKSFKICNVIDEFTGEHIGFRLDKSINAAAVVELLDVIACQRGGRPRVIRMDNGPEFIFKTLKAWAAEEGTTEAFIPPGMPWHNGFVESFHNRLRDEFLEDALFNDVAHGCRCVTDWSHRYNNKHPHSALGNTSPTGFANNWHRQHTPETAYVTRPYTSAHIKITNSAKMLSARFN